MLDPTKRKTIDLLIEQFWKHGYLTVSRKFGTYLPEPAKVGGFEVDIVAKQRKNYAIGITLHLDDFKNPGLYEKITFLASRKTKFTQKAVLLYIGVESKYYKNAKALLEKIDAKLQKNIKLVAVSERPPVTRFRNRERKNVLFS